MNKLYVCKICNKHFDSVWGLNAHQWTHLQTPRKFNPKRNCRNCPFCKKQFFGRKKKVYCSRKCFIENRKLNKKTDISNGVHVDIQTIKKFIIEEHGNYCFECGIGSIWNNKPLKLHIDHIDR